jgi:PAS domain S-box-containing protein
MNQAMVQEHKSTGLTQSSPEVEQIAQLSRQILELVKDQYRELPQALVEKLNLTGTSLGKIGQGVKRVHEERANLQALNEISQVVNSSLEINEVLKIVMDTIVRLTNAERGFLMLREEKQDGGVEFKIRIARNWEQESIDSLESAISRSVIDRAVADGEPILTTNAQEDPRFTHAQSIIMHNLRSILCVPLKVKGELTGVIYTDNRFQSGIFTDAEKGLLTTFANQAAIALENARLFEAARRTLAEVTELKNLMDNVFASIASGVITTDLRGQVTLCNQAAQAILGNLQHDLTGQDLNEISPFICGDITVQSLCEQVEQVRQTGKEIVGMEVTSVLPDRGSVNLIFNLSPLKDVTQSTQGVAIVMNDLTENKKLEAQRRLFERMVSPAVISQINPNQLQLGGTRSEITALFADVRGFTRFSERYDPVELVKILNLHLATVAEAVLDHEGTIDKFLGDAVMAWYNAPIPQPDHALRAVLTALDIRQNLPLIQASLPEEAHLSFGVGIHFGEAVLGLVGTEKRVEYTAIGDSVNTAKRIQENCAPGQILISKTAYALVKDFIDVQAVEPVIAKGKSQPLEVYEVLGRKA